ncbi:DUF397 domain-containing protein [Streptomyces sp. IB201691-2A2]|nr:DUF397 domain-containing protein [Streptomyces sp. IB201691-2A2]
MRGLGCPRQRPSKPLRRPLPLPRHSKNPAGPVLTLDPATFTTFVNWTTTAVTHNR